MDFDPKSVQLIFLNAVEQIKKIRDDNDIQIESLVQFTREAEEEHMKKLVELEASFADIATDFKKLDKRISKVATTAVRIGFIKSRYFYLF